MSTKTNEPLENSDGLKLLIDGDRTTQTIDQQLNPDGAKTKTCSTEEPITLPPNCCPSVINKRFIVCDRHIPISMQMKWKRIRLVTHRLVENQVFEWVIIISILASSTALVNLLYRKCVISLDCLVL